jgi:hypothetical protein
MPDTPGAKFQAVLNELGIVRVICIDDIYDSRVDLEGILVWAMHATNKNAMTGILKALGQALDLSSDTATPELRTLLNENPPIAIEMQARIDRHNLKKDSSALLSDENKQLFTDRSVLSRLDEIMAGFENFHRLTPTQWQAQKAGLLASLVGTSTLFIFDENLGQGVPPGTEHIRDIAGSANGEKASFGLLSYTIMSGAEHEHTRNLQAQNIAATAISKRDLSSEKGIEQLQVRLRAAVLWKESKELRAVCKIALEAAHSYANERVHELSPLEFDEVVFRSSYQEGVHEMDTLVRVYTNAFATSLRETLRSNLTALRDIDKLRNFRGEEAETASHGSTAWMLQRNEYYESGAYINSCMMPPEAGDIYKITIEDGSRAEYVLIAPPCDLMVRNTSGTRESGTTQAVFCRIRNQKPDEKQTKKTFPLDFYNAQNGTSAWVYLTEAFIVDLWLLDLCSIDPKGRATRVVNDSIPDHLSDGWKLKCKNNLAPKSADLVAAWKAWADLEDHIKASAGLRPAHGIALSNQLIVKVRVRDHQNASVLCVGIRRVQRLAPILQGELIRTYSDYIARPARPHSLSVDSSVGS